MMVLVAEIQMGTTVSAYYARSHQRSIQLTAEEVICIRCRDVRLKKWCSRTVHRKGIQELLSLMSGDVAEVEEHVEKDGCDHSSWVHWMNTRSKQQE
jgi:hypothetical protein